MPPPSAGCRPRLVVGVRVPALAPVRPSGRAGVLALALPLGRGRATGQATARGQDAIEASGRPPRHLDAAEVLRAGLLGCAGWAVGAWVAAGA